MAGPKGGRWRDSIVRRVRTEPGGFPLNSILPAGYSLSEYQSAHIAARTLARDQRVRLDARMGEGGRYLTWVFPGKRPLPDPPPARDIVVRVRVADLLAEAA